MLCWLHLSLKRSVLFSLHNLQDHTWFYSKYLDISYSIQIIIPEILFVALQRLNTYFVKVAQSDTLIFWGKLCNLNKEDHNLKLANKGHIDYDELNKIYHKFCNNCSLCFEIRLEIKSLFVETIFFNLFSWMRFYDRSCFSGQYKAIQIER